MVIFQEILFVGNDNYVNKMHDGRDIVVFKMDACLFEFKL